MLSVLNWLGWLIALFWLWHAGVAINFLLYYQLDNHIRTLPPLTQFPKLSIIVSARDEETAIRQTLMSLLALDYPNFEVLAVNDRSRDTTGAIMDELQLNFPRLKVIHITDLPDGWLGKNHAMHSAAQQASGDYLLFTDGDVVFAPTALTYAMQEVITRNWDHLALLPRFLPGSYAENSVLRFMGLLFIMKTHPFLIANPDSRSFAGVGAFNLIRRTCYDRIGGFAQLRLEVVDDIALGREVKHHRFRSQLLFAEHLLQVRWQQQVSGLIHGIEKNSFATLNYSVLNLLAVSALLKLVIVFPYLATLFLPTSVIFGYVSALLIMHALLAYMGYKAKVGWHISCALLFSATVTLWALWRSAWLTISQGGIYWRDTFYPLVLLKSKVPSQPPL